MLHLVFKLQCNQRCSYLWQSGPQVRSCSFGRDPLQTAQLHNVKKHLGFMFSGQKTFKLTRLFTSCDTFKTKTLLLKLRQWTEQTWRLVELFTCLTDGHLVTWSPGHSGHLLTDWWKHLISFRWTKASQVVSVTSAMWKQIPTTTKSEKCPFCFDMSCVFGRMWPTKRQTDTWCLCWSKFFS